MKTFFTLLLKGIEIALAVSLGVCFLAWHWGDWRTIGWFAVGVLVAWQVCKYLRSDVQIDAITDEYGKILENEHSASIGEKISELILGAFLVVIIASCLYGFGLIEEALLNRPKAIFELTMLRGFALLSAAVFVLGMASLLAYAIKNFTVKAALHIISVLLKWLVIVAISCSVALGVFYYCLPPINW